MKHLALILALLLPSSALADDWVGIRTISIDQNAVACAARALGPLLALGVGTRSPTNYEALTIIFDAFYVVSVPGNTARRIYIRPSGSVTQNRLADYWVQTETLGGNRVQFIHYTSVNGHRATCAIDRAAGTATFSGTF